MAKTRDVYHDEATIPARDHLLDVHHSRRLHRHGHQRPGLERRRALQRCLWFVEHDLPAWQPCGERATAPGEQQFSFYRVDATTLTGKDKTTGPSGSCGVSALPRSKCRSNSTRW